MIPRCSAAPPLRQRSRGLAILEGATVDQKSAFEEAMWRISKGGWFMMRIRM